MFGPLRPYLDWTISKTTSLTNLCVPFYFEGATRTSTEEGISTRNLTNRACQLGFLLVLLMRPKSEKKEKKRKKCSVSFPFPCFKKWELHSL